VRICVVGPGRIGGNLARRFRAAGHDVVATFARHAEGPKSLPPEGVTFIAEGATAIAGAQVIVISVPWASIDAAWASLGDIGDVAIVDTTNPFAADGIVELPTTSAAFNARRFGVRPYAKAFNTLTSAFQVAAIDKASAHRAAMFYAASDQRAADAVEPLIASVGFVPIFVGGPADSALMEAPRRPGAVYGEEYTPDDAVRAVEAYRRGVPIQPRLASS